MAKAIAAAEAAEARVYAWLQAEAEGGGARGGAAGEPAGAEEQARHLHAECAQGQQLRCPWRQPVASGDDPAAALPEPTPQAPPPSPSPSPSGQRSRYPWRQPVASGDDPAAALLEPSPQAPPPSPSPSPSPSPWPPTQPSPPNPPPPPNLVRRTSTPRYAPRHSAAHAAPPRRHRRQQMVTTGSLRSPKRASLPPGVPMGRAQDSSRPARSRWRRSPGRPPRARLRGRRIPAADVGAPRARWRAWRARSWQRRRRRRRQSVAQQRACGGTACLCDEQVKGRRCALSGCKLDLSGSRYICND